MVVVGLLVVGIIMGNFGFVFFVVGVVFLIEGYNDFVLWSKLEK